MCVSPRALAGFGYQVVKGIPEILTLLNILTIVCMCVCVCWSFLDQFDCSFII